MTTTAALLIVTALVAWGAVGGVRRLSIHYNILDIPNERSAHTTPMPTLGGVGVVVAVWLAVLAATLLDSAPTAPAASVLVFCTLNALLGLWDDLADPRPVWRFLGQVAVASLSCAVLGPVAQISIPFLSPVSLGWGAYPLTVLWLVGVTNFFNFMDGIDGLAGGMALVAGAISAAAFYAGGAPGVGFSAAAVAAAAAGFLRHNLPPATIFMGNVGSSFFGFYFAATAVVGVSHHRFPLPFFILLLGPFLFDATVTILRRMLGGERWYTAHHSHFYQRLFYAGWSFSRIDGLELVSMAALGGLACLYLYGDDATRLGAMVAGLVLLAAFAFGVEMIICRSAGSGDH